MRWAWALLVSVVLVGCARSHQGIQPEELRITARWCEDVARGIPRRPGELELVGASAEQMKLATWLSGDDVSGRFVPPHLLRERAARWPSIAAGLRSGVLLRDQNRGLIGPAPSLAPGDFTLAAALADAENHDRRTLDVLILSRVEVSRSAERWYADEALAARRAADATAGGSVGSVAAPAR
jgi:hypothetical protein